MRFFNLNVLLILFGISMKTMFCAETSKSWVNSRVSSSWESRRHQEPETWKAEKILTSEENGTKNDVMSANTSHLIEIKEISDLSEKTLGNQAGKLVGLLMGTLFSPLPDPQNITDVDLSEMRGRKSKHSHKMASAVTAAIVSGGFMTLITLAVLSAMAGKALVAAILSIIISGVSLWQNGVGLTDPNQTPNTIEILAKPVYRQPTNHHQDYYFEPPHSY